LINSTLPIVHHSVTSKSAPEGWLADETDATQRLVEPVRGENEKINR